MVDPADAEPPSRSRAPAGPTPNGAAGGDDAADHATAAGPAAPHTPAPREPGADEPPAPGCMPAIIAITLLAGMLFAIAFAFASWWIFQQRGNLAVRTLRSTVIPELQQSRLDPEEKRLVVRQLSDLADDLEGGMYENWQAGGIMQRLVTSPLMRWGDLQTLQRWAETNLPEQERDEAERQISRFFRAVELDRVVARDVHDVLAPVSAQDDPQGFAQLRPQFSAAEVNEVIQRAKLVADRAEVPEQTFPPVSLPQFINRQIELGSRSGAA